MSYGEYITTTKDYETKSLQGLPSALQTKMPTALCKEKIRINTFRNKMPKNSIEEKILWNLTIN